MNIGQVLAELAPDFPGISHSKIRFLEDKGLIDPERTSSGYRKFSARDVDRLRYVLRMQRVRRDDVDDVHVRVVHQVRLVADAEEGTGINALPNGVYGFTYSPALPNAPLFAALGALLVGGSVGRERCAGIRPALMSSYHSL